MSLVMEIVIIFWHQNLWTYALKCWNDLFKALKTIPKLRWCDAIASNEYWCFETLLGIIEALVLAQFVEHLSLSSGAGLTECRWRSPRLCVSLGSFFFFLTEETHLFKSSQNQVQLSITILLRTNSSPFFAKTVKQCISKLATYIAKQREKLTQMNSNDSIFFLRPKASLISSVFLDTKIICVSAFKTSL